MKELELFEKDMYDVVKNIAFCENSNYGKFQKELNKDLSKLKKSESVVIAADKSRNFYTCDVSTYENLRENNLKKQYMKSTIKEVEHIDVKSRKFAENLKLENHMQKYTRTECFITLEDHKDNFISRPQCRLINIAKNDLGQVVKVKVE